MCNTAPRLCTSVLFHFTAIDDDSIDLVRNPVNFETVGGDFGAVKDYDDVRDNRTAFEEGLHFEPDRYDGGCCQVFRCIAFFPGDQTNAPNFNSLSVMWLKNGEEIVHSPGRTEIMNTTRYQSGQDSTRFIFQLHLISFEPSDIGVYQCVYTDFDTDRELVFSTPFRLDSGTFRSM